MTGQGVAKITDFGLVGLAEDKPAAEESLEQTTLRGRMGLPDQVESAGESVRWEIAADVRWETITATGGAVGTPPYMAPGTMGLVPLRGVSGRHLRLRLHPVLYLLRPPPLQPRPPVPPRHAGPQAVPVGKDTPRGTAAPIPGNSTARTGRPPGRAHAPVPGKGARPPARQLSGHRPPAQEHLSGSRKKGIPPSHAAGLPPGVGFPEQPGGVVQGPSARNAGAHDAWEEALRADPHHIEATYNLAMFQWSLGGGVVRRSAAPHGGGGSGPTPNSGGTNSFLGKSYLTFRRITPGP